MDVTTHSVILQFAICNLQSAIFSETRLHCMRVLIYEFVTGGGLYQLAPSDVAVQSLLREGRAMIRALAEDFARLPDIQLATLRDSRLDRFHLPPCTLHEVRQPDDEKHWLSRLASQCDWSVIIAPEFNRFLWDRCQLVERSGGRLLSPSSQLIAWASDKQETCRRWQLAGVPVPRSCLLHCGQSPPDDFAFPCVLKPPDGAGSLAVQRVDRESDLRSALWPTDPMRLEQFCAGIPCSTAIIGGPAGQVWLPPCRQTLSQDGRFSYLGGHVLCETDLRLRAERLVAKAATILRDLVGYAGIDFILGHAPDGSADVAIELNPRLTTSYIGLRHAVRENLAQVMLDLAQGKEVRVTRNPQRVHFDADGRVTCWATGS